MIYTALFSCFVSFARKGAKSLLKPVNLATAAILFAGAVYAQASTSSATGFTGSIADTSWATGWINVSDSQTNSSISKYLDMYMIPLNVQMTNPDTIKDNMGGSGLYAFNLPVHIDTLVGINISTSQSLEHKVFPTMGSELNVFFGKNVSQGSLEIYDMSGKRIRQKEFSGDNTYIAFPDIANGVYVYAIRTEEGISTGKFLKQGSDTHGPAGRPSNFNDENKSNARTTTFSADYKILLKDPSGTYFDLDTIINLSEGNNGLINLWMNHKPESVIDLKVNAWHSLDSTLESNAFVYIQDSQGNIDSARTNNAGFTIFQNVGQNKTYTFGIGKENFLAWDNITLTTPNSNTLNDTITKEVNYSLIPDQKYSRKGQITIPTSNFELHDLFLAFNIPIGKGDTLRFHLGAGYSAQQIANANQWLANYSAWTGVPTKIEANAFIIPVPTSFDPDTSDLSILGTNVTYGTSNCSPKYFSYNGNAYTSSATMTNSFYSEKSFHKEVGRITFDEASGVMQPTASDMTTSNSAHMEILYELNRRHFEGKHDPTNVQKLTSTSTIIPN